MSDAPTEELQEGEMSDEEKPLKNITFIKLAQCVHCIAVKDTH